MYKVGRRKIGFKGLKSLCFRDCGAGHVSNSAQHPCLAQNWMCKDSLENSFNVECAHGLR